MTSSDERSTSYNEPPIGSSLSIIWASLIWKSEPKWIKLIRNNESEWKCHRQSLTADDIFDQNEILLIFTSLGFFCRNSKMSLTWKILMWTFFVCLTQLCWRLCRVLSVKWDLHFWGSLIHTVLSAVMCSMAHGLLHAQRPRVRFLAFPKFFQEKIVEVARLINSAAA